ncbi:hypothetical protein ACFL5A_02160 [Gemmatimonadota bacterium]
MSDPPQTTRANWLRRAVIEAPIIVGSILLAFAIDAGWDVRGERVERDEILEGLREEYSEHRADYIGTIARAEERLADMELLFSGSAAMAMGIDRVNRSLFQLIIVTTNDPGRGVRDALISSGRLELIRDVQLRMRLANWEGVVDEVRENQALMRQLSASQIVPYLAGAEVPLARVFSANGTEHHLWPPSMDWPTGSSPVGDLEDTYQRILDDPEFQSFLSVRYTWLAWTVTELGAVLTEIDTILDGLELELGRK